MISANEVQRRFDLWSRGYWEIPDNLDISNFDFEWRPNSYDRPYIHQFGTQHQKTGGPRFVIPENEGIKYQSHQHAVRLPDIDNRSWRPLVSNCTIDFSWHPDETDPPFIYVFGNQWHDMHTMPTYQYRVKGATEKKYVDAIKATLLPDKTCWEIPTDIDDTTFDYSWCPSPFEPPLIHQFGTQWQRTSGPKYIVTNATDVKYVDTMRVKKLPDMRKWRILEEIENDKFDFSWHPDDTEPPMMYEFGTQWQIAGGPIYVTRGSTQKKYCSDQIAIRIATENRCYRPLVPNIEFDYSWHPDPNDPPYIYVFGNQWYSGEIMPTLLYRVKNATEKKYINNVITKLTPTIEYWTIPDDIDDSMFDYSWCPSPVEPPFIYQFGTQHQKTGGPIYTVKNATEIKYVSDLKVIKKPNLHNWRIIEPIDNSTFDFSWHPDDTDGEFTYVFGNTFYPSEVMPTIMYKNKKASDHKFSNEIKANLDIPTVLYEDSVFDKITQTKFSTTYIRFAKNNTLPNYSCIKNEKIKTLFPIHIIGDEVLVYKDAKSHLYDKLYDYPCITYKTDIQHNPLDIVFLSNGEASADENYKHLLKLTEGKQNRVVRIDNVKGRVASQHTSANASETNWYFLVNGKLRVDENFDFNWQPDIYKSSRHYIFNATNPVNGLVYGHQAIVANNKKLTLNTVVRGLDYTMDSLTEVVNINSGIAMYNTSKWDTWRTAFREMIKLCCNTDQDSIDRGSAWLNKGAGAFGEYSKMGARDAVNYYNSVDGNMEKLMLSYDWEWLHQYYQNNCP